MSSSWRRDTVPVVSAVSGGDACAGQQSSAYPPVESATNHEDVKVRWKDLSTVVPGLWGHPYLLEVSQEGEALSRLKTTGFHCVRVEVPERPSEKEMIRRLGVALGFPDHFSPNWDAYTDCIYEAATTPPAYKVVLLANANRMFEESLYLFARVIHLLLQTTEGVGLSEGGAAQLEYIFSGEWDGRRIDFRSARGQCYKV